ncbi:dicarboxylate carrier UCP2-like isoform X1 [Antennarius striatus]|uniref:dicarboxylate carrier UCP2-like isoform X1 n=1 Tax=Antennarius striatus TaxID=241820 RepID=UPI0035B305EE
MVGMKPRDVVPSAAVKFFGAGTAACIADLVTFPLDTAKVRLQIQGESQKANGNNVTKYRGVFGTITTMVRTEGPRSLYNGLVAGLQRQMSFASVRIGLYDSMKQFYTRGTESAGIVTRLMAGCTTGAMAVAFAQPTDVVKVRFQAQARRADGGRRYNSTLDAYKTIARDEGVRGLWKGIIYSPQALLNHILLNLRQAKKIPALLLKITLSSPQGCMPNITRNAIVNCSELVTYDVIKELILKYDLMTDNLPCHFTAGFGAGFCTTVVASPVDVVKTRFMNSGSGQYNSAIHCAITMLKREGPTAFYKGFLPSFLRLGSWNIVMFVTYEQIKRGMIRAQQCWESPF